jgi:hypothetical protein
MVTERISLVISANDTASPQLKKVNAELTEMGITTDKLKGKNGSMGGIQQLGNQMQMLGAAFAGNQIMQAIGDLNRLGIEAQGTASIFEAMAKDFGGADDLLNKLRKTTNNVVSDMDLMSGASSIMRMGLADSSEGVNQLIEMAVKLKKPYETASEAIDNFTLMLSNQSVARLDSFGIASGTVRTRIDELIKSGQALTREEAFTMAVMEEGTEAIEKLGDAADITVSSVNRLTTALENVTAELGMVVSGAIEAGAQLIELGTIGVDMAVNGEGGNFLLTAVDAVVSEITGGPMVTAQNKPNQQAMLNAPFALPAGYTLDGRGNYNVPNRNNDPQTGSFALTPDQADLLNNQPELRAQREAQKQALITRLSKAGEIQYNNIIDGFMESQARAQEAAIQKADRLQETMDAGGNVYSKVIGGFKNSQNRASVALLESEERFQEALEIGSTAYSQMLGGFKNSQNRAASAELDILTKSIFDQQFKTELGGASLDLRNTMTEGRGNLGLMTPESIDEAKRKYEEILEIASNVESSQWLDDSQREIMATIVSDAKSFADEAERAQQAFENMSLSELFGQSDGGRLGELGDMVLSNIEDEDQRATIEDALNLETGRETELSQAFEDSFAPLLADVFDQFGEEIGIQATEAALVALENAQMNGLSADDAMAQVRAGIGFTYAPGMDGGLLYGEGPDMGDVESDISGGGSISESMENATTSAMGLETIMKQIDEATSTITVDPLEASVSRTVDSAVELTNQLDKAAKPANKTLHVRVKFKYDDAAGKKLLEDEFSTIYDNNGGVPPDGNP